LIHELGHFIAARACGVNVEQFSIGFGKALASFKRKGIEYRIGWIPLGGYVKMRGENPKDEHTDEFDAFQSQVWWKKIIIALAGPLANLILATMLLIFSFAIPMHLEDSLPIVGKIESSALSMLLPNDHIQAVDGIEVRGWYDAISKLDRNQPTEVMILRGGQKTMLMLPNTLIDSLATKAYPMTEAIVGEVVVGLPAWKAGLKPADKILSVNGQAVSDWYAMRDAITANNHGTLLLEIERAGKRFSKSMSIENSIATDNQPRIGIMQHFPVTITRQIPFTEAISSGLSSAFGFSRDYFLALGKLIQKPRDFAKSIGTPVMVVSYTEQLKAKKGINHLLMFFAGLNLMIMIFNLLPIPVLDGGHVIFALWQAVSGKTISQKVQYELQRWAMKILLFLMVFAFYNDLSRLFTRFLNSGLN